MPKPTRVKTLHFKVRNISRNKPRPDNAVAACAYQSRQDLYDEKQCKIQTYERKGGLFARAIVAPDNAPAWMRDADEQRLWERFGNEIERMEDSHNRWRTAMLAKHLIFAAPRDLTNEQNWKLGTAFAGVLKARGFAVGLSMHDEEAKDGGRNPHFHLIFSTRPVDENGFGKLKSREFDSRRYGANSPIMELRREYFRLVNEALAQAGVKGVEYDPEKQEDKDPGKHLGKVGHATKGWAKEKADRIRQHNREASLQNHINVHMGRIDSPQWRKEQKDWVENKRRVRGAGMASRDLAQQALPTTERGEKAADTAVDRALHSASWRAREDARQRKDKGPPEL